MATILLLIHFISLWLTLMSLLQPCDDNCIKKNCDSTNSHASERILDRSSEIEHVTVGKNAVNIGQHYFHVDRYSRHFSPQ